VLAALVQPGTNQASLHVATSQAGLRCSALQCNEVQCLQRVQRLQRPAALGQEAPSLPPILYPLLDHAHASRDKGWFRRGEQVGPRFCAVSVRFCGM
jgi:hypothetical protein